MKLVSTYTDEELLNAMYHSKNKTMQDIAARIEGIIDTCIENALDEHNTEEYRRGYEDATEELL